MEDGERRELQERLAQLELTVGQLQRRIFSLEEAAQPNQLDALRRLRRGVDGPPEPPAFAIHNEPPPVQTPPPPPAYILKPLATPTPAGGLDELFPPQETWQKIEPSRTAPQPTPAKPKVEAEYQIGAQVLPRVGAVVFLLGLLFLVALAIKNRTITQEMQWWGEMALCAVFIIVGLIKRNEKEDFGQILIGIGSCGLYFSFAGAYAYKHSESGDQLLSGNQLVLSYILLGLANLSFAAWRSSKSFYAIGLLGGLVGAALPMGEWREPGFDNWTTAAILHITISIPAAIIVWRNRWYYTCLASIVVTSAALIFVCTSRMAWEWRVALLYFNTLMWLAVYAKCYRRDGFDNYRVFPAAAAMAAGLAAWAMHYGTGGTIHITLYGLGLAALGAAYWNRSEVASRFLIAAVAIPSILAPFGFEALAASLIFAALASFYSLVSARFFPTAFSGLAALDLVLALTCYTAKVMQPQAQANIPAVLVLIAATCMVAWAAGRASKQAEGWAVGGALVILPLVAIIGAGEGFDSQVGSSIAMLLYAAVLAIFSWRQRWMGLLGAGWFTLGMASLTFIGLFDTRPLAWSAELALIAGFMAAFLLLGYFTLVIDRTKVNAVIAASGIPTGLFFLRFTFVWLTIGPTQLHWSVSFMFAIILYALACGVIAWWRRWAGALALAWTTALFFLPPYLSADQIQVLTWQADAGFMATFMALLIGLGVVTGRIIDKPIEDEREQTLIAVVASILGLVFMRLAYVFLSESNLGWHPHLALTTAALVFALGIGLAAMRLGWKSLAIVTWIYSFVWLWPYFDMLRLAPAWSSEAPILVAAMCLSALTIFLTKQFSSESITLLVVLATVLWALFTRLSFVLLSASPVNIDASASVTIAWTVYAISLIAVGFIKKLPALRYYAFAVFASTLGKVFLVDLAGLDAGIRVGVLMGLGAAMIAGGYWYVRARRGFADEN